MSDLSTVISSNGPHGGTSVSVVPPIGSSRRVHLHSTVNSQAGHGPGGRSASPSSGPYVVVKSIAPRHPLGAKHHSTTATTVSSSSSSSVGNSPSTGSYAPSRQAPSIVGAKTKPDVPSLVTVNRSSGPSTARQLNVNQCDNGNSQSQIQQQQQHSLTNCNVNKSSFNNNSSPTNYILLNKLRIGQARNRSKPQSSTTVPVRSEQQPSSLSLTQKSISNVNATGGTVSNTYHRRGSSVGPTRQHSSPSSVASLLSSSGGATTTSGQHGGHRSAGSGNTPATLSSNNRPVITRVNAHVWSRPLLSSACSNRLFEKEMLLTNVDIKTRGKDHTEMKVKASSRASNQQQQRQTERPFTKVEHRTVLKTDSVKDLASSLVNSHDTSDEKVPETMEISFPESTIAMNYSRAAGRCDNDFDSTGMSSNSPTHSLGMFIENLSPEIIFLMNECAKLCINLRAFDEKLNEMQRVFVSGALKNSYESRQWTRVIERSRKWLKNVRIRNQFLSNPRKHGSITTASGSTSGADSGDDSSSGQDVFSAEDELLHLLDRIAQFSSNLLLKTESENSPKADVSLNSMTALKSGTFECDIEWLRSLPDELQSILKPVFVAGNGSDRLADIGADVHCDFVQLSDMNPLVLEKLVENVQANARLAQLQREFDRLLCTHLKSSLTQPEPNPLQYDSVPGSTSGSSFYTSLPTAPAATKPSPPTVNRTPIMSCNQRTSQQIFKQSSQLPVHISTAEPVSDLSNHNHHHHHQHTPIFHPDMNIKNTQNTGAVHCCNCSGSANLISDNDSGGEFTATTVTNEFQQSSSASATEDELSSLLNQIALCSQKIVQETSGSGSAPSSSTSTSVGCCCSSSSIEHHNKWCQPSHHPHLNHSGHQSLGPGQSLQHHPQLYRNSSTKSLCRSQNMECCQPADVAAYNWTPADEQSCCVSNAYISQPINSRTVRSQSHYSPARGQSFHNAEYYRRFGAMHKSQSSSSLKMRRSFSQNPNNFHQQPTWTNPYEDNYHQQHLEPCYENDLHSRAKMGNKMSPSKFRERSQISLSDAVMDCFSNNMTGFMLSNSAIDVLSPADESPTSASPLAYPVSDRTRKHLGPVQRSEAISGSNPLDSFILDPNMDVESFLNEMEKELEDNCYTSAPTYEARYGLQQRMHPLSNNSSPKHSPHYSPVRGPLKHQHSLNPYQYLHSTSKQDPLAISVQNMAPLAEHHSPNTGNWRLSQRNSVIDLLDDKSAQQNMHTMPNGHFPFPSMTSMPNGSIGNVTGIVNGPCSSANQSSSFRRLVPSSNGRDLLDKFRAQVISRANQEADQQLKQIDHWLSNHLNDSANVDAIHGHHHERDDEDVVRRNEHDDDPDDCDGKTLAVTQNLIHFS